MTDASAFFPPTITLPSLREAAAGCRACPLYQIGTQTVFGEGPPQARVFMIGEQPGDQEDIEGHPFVGPAGRLLDQALQDAGIVREDAYLSNVVKHFKWIPKGKRRLHQKPNSKEIGACIPWLEQEIELVKPRILVLLGATAAQALMGKQFRVTQQRGELLETRWRTPALATVHPSSILRQRTPEDRHREMDMFVADLRKVATLLR